MHHQKIAQVEGLFTVFPSSLVVVYGANGSGKTTLLKKIALSHIFPIKTIELTSDVSYLGHKFGVKLNQTVEDYLIFCLGNVDFLTYCKRYNLQPDKKIFELSFGQVQKVGLIRVLISNKPLWILDEPFSNVDADSQNLFIEDLRLYLASGGAAIIATHEKFPLEHESVYL